MRMIAADIKHAYVVHKTYTEYLSDSKMAKVPDDELYAAWTQRLTTDSHRYILLMHGKKVVGMVWGQKFNDGFLIEGRFLRRMYRGKKKFAQELLLAVKEISKDFDRVLMILPRVGPKIAGKYKVFGVLVEQVKKGRK
jgi:hypothetical protein